MRRRPKCFRSDISPRLQILFSLFQYSPALIRWSLVVGEADNRYLIHERQAFGNISLPDSPFICSS